MQATTPNTDGYILDCASELHLDVCSAYSEWVGIATRIDIAGAGLAGQETAEAFFAIPLGLLQTLSALHLLITCHDNPVSIDWLRLDRDVQESAGHVITSLADWRNKLQTR